MPLNMYEEYLQSYTEHTKKFGLKVAIFLMVGIFYEMYDVKNPETGETKTSFSSLIELLDLKVTVKKGEGPGGLDGLVAGIPDYAVHKWAAKLTQLGWTVVLVDQVKNIQGKVISRKTERILTPGTHIEAVGSNDVFLTFLYISESRVAPSLAVTSLDLTTGHLHVFETQAQGSSEAWTSNDIVQFMEVYPPKEVLWSSENSKINETLVKNIFGFSQGTTFHKREALTTGAWTKPEFREDFLKSQCSLRSLLPTHVALHISPGSMAETALLSLLYSIKELWPSMRLGQLMVFPWVPGSIMRLGENALVQLHMIVQESDRQDVLGLLDKCSSPMGHRGLRQRLLKPSASFEIIQENLNAVEAWTRKQDTLEQITRRLKTMVDIDRLYRRIQQGSITASDLQNLDSTFKAIAWICTSEQSLETKEKVNFIRDSVFKIFNPEKFYSASEDISLFIKGLVPELDSLEDKISEQMKRLQDWILARATSISVSQDSFKPEFREGSLVVKGPRGILQTLGASGKLPPNVTAKINKTGSHLESPELDQIFIILSRLRESLKKQQSIALVEHGTLLANNLFDSWFLVSNWITQVDVNSTLARMATEYGYTKPSLLNEAEGSLTIKGLRHPLLEAQDRKIPYVQHDVCLDANQSWLLYGLNASGKSSLMRAVGLATLLAQAGSFVPCSSMTLSPFSSLHTRIINTDNLWMGLSSFAVEMSEMRDIFRVAGPKSLVLGDELCSGTETTSATALVAAGLKGLIKRGARFLFATHLHGLSKIQEVAQDPGLKIWHLHVEYDKFTDKLIYHRTLRAGSGSSLYGLEVAKAMRIPDDILEDAIRFRKQLTGEAELSQSVGSSWNSSVTCISCSLCSATELANLEVHHIKERRLASNQGHLSDGTNVHAAANLIVLCESCHNDVHSGKKTIGTLIQTSDGMERSVSTVSSIRQSKWSSEDLEQIQMAISKFPNLSATSLSKYLLNQHSIQISSGSLRKMIN